MKRTFWGALLGAVMLALAAPAGAATVTGTSIVNSTGSLAAGEFLLATGLAPAESPQAPGELLTAKAGRPRGDALSQGRVKLTPSSSATAAATWVTS